MSSADITTTNPVMSGVQVLQKINYMVNSNITILFILVLVIVVLGFGLYYFTKSLIKTLNNYYRYRVVIDTSSSDSLKDKSADNEAYPDTSAEQDDDELRMVIDNTNFMPKSKRDFLAKLKIENTEYNREKTEFVTRRLNYQENDDIIDDKIMYKDHDNYSYEREES